MCCRKSRCREQLHRRLEPGSPQGGFSYRKFGAHCASHTHTRRQTQTQASSCLPTAHETVGRGGPKTPQGPWARESQRHILLQPGSGLFPQVFPQVLTGHPNWVPRDPAQRKVGESPRHCRNGLQSLCSEGPRGRTHSLPASLS